MKFVKLRLYDMPRSKGTYSESWHLIIDNDKDLFKYLEIDTEAYGHAFLALDRNDKAESPFSVSHSSGYRLTNAAAMLNIGYLGTKEGEEFHPLLGIADFCNKKGNGMKRLMDRVGAIRVGESGAYCGYESFVRQWDGEIIQTIEKADIGFPIESETMECETIILENQTHASKSFTDKINKLSGTESQTITNLREKDLQWVVKCVVQAKNVAFESQLNDREQIDKFMQLFTKLPPKNIYISVSYREDDIKNHPLF